MSNETVFGAIIFCAGYRYVIDEQDEMVRVGYRESGQSDEYAPERDVLIAPSDLPAVASALTRLSELNGSKA